MNKTDTFHGMTGVSIPGTQSWASTATAYLVQYPSLAVAWGAITTCMAYLCVYMVRFPPFVLQYTGQGYLGAAEKAWLSLACAVAFVLAKIPGALILSQIPRKYRPLALFGEFAIPVMFVSVAVRHLQGTALTLSFLVGYFPMSWIYTTLFQYLEGRRTAELMTAALNLVVVFGSSIARAAAAKLLEDTEDAFSMPLRLALLALPIYIVSISLLHLLPPPTTAEQQSQTKRQPASWEMQKTFLQQYRSGLGPLAVTIGIAVSFRGFRDFYAVEVYTEALGRVPDAADFLWADWPGTLLLINVRAHGTLGGLSSCALMLLFHRIKDNRCLHSKTNQYLITLKD